MSEARGGLRQKRRSPGGATPVYPPSDPKKIQPPRIDAEEVGPCKKKAQLRGSYAHSVATRLGTVAPDQVSFVERRDYGTIRDSYNGPFELYGGMKPRGAEIPPCPRGHNEGMFLVVYNSRLLRRAWFLKPGHGVFCVRAIDCAGRAFFRCGACSGTMNRNRSRTRTRRGRNQTG
jgi:hypothetical protein